MAPDSLMISETLAAGGDGPTVVLASASAPRRRLLAAAGVVFQAEAADVDEQAIKRTLRGASPADIAAALAESKARRTGARYPDSLVIGADQTLGLDGTAFDKPPTMAAARQHLQRLSGKTHCLHSALCVVRHGRRVWRINDTARLTMRPFGPAFIDRYLAAAGDGVLASVGGYRLEALGAQLFTRIEGDYFTILGLPLLPLLACLRDCGAVAA